MYFNELNIKSSLLRSIADRGYKEMTAVQEKTLPLALRGQDVAVQSQTGTGKTAAFLITLYEHLLEKNVPRSKALIIVPTRELAVQIEKEARLLNNRLGFRIGTFFGGVGYRAQLSSLKKGLDIIIGTPGRLLDLSQKGHLKLKDTAVLIIDEADRLFDMGFLPDIIKIIRKLSPRKARQNMLFSATLDHKSRKIAAEHMNRPVSISVTPEKLTVDTIFQELYYVKSHIKLNLMLGILKAQVPQNVLIFTNMRHTAFRLAKKLQLNGFRSQHLTGGLPQSKRLRIIDDFKTGKLAYLVATDVAARGLHIDDLDMVINYDLPQDCENYVHRIGRTARAGNSGKAISLASEGMANHLEAIESYIGMKIPVQTADIDLFATDKSEEYWQREKSRNNRTRNNRRNFYSKNKKTKNGSAPRSRSSNTAEAVI
jgi:ATP-dependent RNA helicase RhlB